MKMYIPGSLTVDTDVDWVIVIGDTDFIWVWIIFQPHTIYWKYNWWHFIETEAQRIQGELKIILGFTWWRPVGFTYCPKTHKYEDA